MSLWIMSACASACISCKAVANFSSSSRDCDPNSLHGGGCNASSITPSAKVQDRAHSLAPRSLVLDTVPSSTVMSFIVSDSLASLHRLLHPVHILNLILHPRRNRVTLQLSIHRQHTTLN